MSDARPLCSSMNFTSSLNGLESIMLSTIFPLDSCNEYVTKNHSLLMLRETAFQACLCSPARLDKFESYEALSVINISISRLASATARNNASLSCMGSEHYSIRTEDQISIVT